MQEFYRQNPPLGVYRIISEAFSILRRRFLPIFGFLIVIGLVTLGTQTLVFVNMPDPTNLPILPLTLLIILSLVVASIQMAVITGIAYEAKLERSFSFGRYIKIGISMLPAYLLLSILALLCVALGFFFIFTPGLYLAAMFSMFISVLVIERAGFKSLGRSIELTSGYRWPILGYCGLFYLLLIAVSIVLGVLFSSAVFAAPGSINALGLVAAFLGSMISGIVFVAFGIGFVLIYIRLRELKEGTSAANLASVFE